MSRAGSSRGLGMAAALALAVILGWLPASGLAQDEAQPAVTGQNAPASEDAAPPPDPSIAPPDADLSTPPAGGKETPADVPGAAEGGEKAAGGAPITVEGMMEGITALPDLDLQLLTATRDRPLFQPDRRPVVPPPPPPEEAPPPDDKVAVEMPFDYELKGIIGSGEGSIAILSQPGLATPLRSRTGDVLNGWTLTRIEPRTLFFTGPAGEERRLSLFDATGAWTTGDDGLRHLTIGPDAGPAAAPDGEAPPPDPSIQQYPQAGTPAPVDQPPQENPPTETEPKEVRKVY